MMIGTKLRLLRASTGLTQDQFAKFLGMSRATYNPLELNRQVPTDDLLRQIEKRLGVKLDDPKIEQFITIIDTKQLTLAA